MAEWGRRRAAPMSRPILLQAKYQKKNRLSAVYIFRASFSRPYISFGSYVREKERLLRRQVNATGAPPSHSSDTLRLFTLVMLTQSQSSQYCFLHFHVRSLDMLMLIEIDKSRYKSIASPENSVIIDFYRQIKLINRQLSSTIADLPTTFPMIDSDRHLRLENSKLVNIETSSNEKYCQ